MKDLLSPTEEQVIAQFKKQITSQFGSRLITLKLFGSKARGEANVESDIDLLILIRNLDWREKNWVIDAASTLFIQTSVNLSPLCLSPEEFDHLLQRERRLALDIEKEGVSL